MLMTVMMSLFAATAAIGMWGEDNNKWGCNLNCVKACS